MKSIMIIIDGMNDDKLVELSNKTPYEYADPQNMEYMKKKGSYGFFDTCPSGFEPDSLSCILTLLGQSKSAIPNGRAYLEAVSEGLDIKNNECVMRCNLVSIDKDGILTSSTGGNLSETNYYEFTKKMNNQLNDNIVKIHHMSAYKNLLILKNSYIDEVIDFPPHQNIGQNIFTLIPDNNMLKEFVLDSMKKLNDSSVKYAFLPWGLAKEKIIPSFYQLHNIKSASVCHTEIVRGISLAMGMYTPIMNNTTADIDTDLGEKANVALNLLRDNEFVFIHINGTDEASHRKNYMEKVRFIKAIDEKLIRVILESVKEEVNILVTSDHSTLCSSGKHREDLQPFILYNNRTNKHNNLGIIDGKDAVKLLSNYCGITSEK